MTNFVVISSNPVSGSRPDQVTQWFYDIEEAKTFVKNHSENTADNYYICECRSSYERSWKGQ